MEQETIENNNKGKVISKDSLSDTSNYSEESLEDLEEILKRYYTKAETDNELKSKLEPLQS